MRCVGWGCRLHGTLLTAIELVLGAVKFSNRCKAAAPFVLPGFRNLAICLGAMAKARLLIVPSVLKAPARLAMLIVLLVGLKCGWVVRPGVLPIVLPP